MLQQERAAPSAEKAADVQKGWQELPNHTLCPFMQGNSSWQQMSAEMNEVISETLKWRAKEFMNLPLPLLTVHTQMFQKAKNI